MLADEQRLVRELVERRVAAGIDEHVEHLVVDLGVVDEVRAARRPSPLAFANSCSDGPSVRSESKLLAAPLPTRRRRVRVPSTPRCRSRPPASRPPPRSTEANGEYESPSSSRMKSVSRFPITSLTTRARMSSRRAGDAVDVNRNDTFAASPCPAIASTTTAPSGGGGSSKLSGSDRGARSATCRGRPAPTRSPHPRRSRR